MAEMSEIEEPGEVFEIEDPTSPSIERKIMKNIELELPPAPPTFLIGRVPFSVCIRRIYCSSHKDGGLHISLFNLSRKEQKFSVTLKKGSLLAEDLEMVLRVIGPSDKRDVILRCKKGLPEKGKLKMIVTLHTKEREIWTR